MKAKEQIWIGDLLVKDDGMLRRMTVEEAGRFIGPNPWNYAFDKVLTEGVAGANASIGDEVVVYTGETIFKVGL